MKKIMYTIVVIFIISIVIYFLSFFYLNNKHLYNNEDFEKVKSELKSGNYLIISNIPKEYYTRLDFFYSPDIYEIYSKPNYTRNARFGYGAYPGEVSYNAQNFKTGQYMDVYTFVFPSYAVYTSQGLGLSFKSPDNELFETYTEPSDVLLLPAPENFSEPKENWVYLVKMTIVAKKDIPDGKYTFELIPGIPSEEKRIEFYNNATNYVDGSVFQAGKFFDFVLYAQS